MMWTKDQDEVIRARGENILVSAAAGSGKTAVLVARILSMITDPENPADIDELLVLTFTKAAAAQMKERVAGKLTEALDADPQNEHLLKQISLIHHAKITTIDSFCSFVVKSFASRIDVDPGFRVADQDETSLLKADVLQSVIEEAYENEEPDFAEAFRNFAETFAPSKGEQPMEDAILRTYEAAVSEPYPKEWLEKCRRNNEAVSWDALGTEKWMKDFYIGVNAIIDAADELAEKNCELLQKPEAPSGKYASDTEILREFTGRLLQFKGDYEELFELVSNFRFPSLAGARLKKGESADIKENLIANRNELKSLIGRLSDECFPLSPKLALSFQQKCAKPLNMLLLMTERFMDAFAEEKRKKNILDFADLEHFALDILRDHKERTPAAQELSEGFREVMVDEYQDSNYIQEAILTALCHPSFDNYFCVGDVKQSIYSFRNARPDLFMQKFESYEKGEGGKRIDLHKNFRSQEGIIDSVNAIFREIMQKDIGGVEYDNSAALTSGAEKLRLIRYDDASVSDNFQGPGMPAGDDNSQYAHSGTNCVRPSVADDDVELMTVYTHEEDASGENLINSAKSEAAKELEARAVAERIADIVSHDRISDPRTKEERPVAYHDIVILLRTMNGWSDVFLHALEERGIPAFSMSSEGYFTTPEVTTLLNYLSIIDNPRQDIPYAAALKSAIGGLSSKELAMIKSAPEYKGSASDIRENENTRTVPKLSCFYDSVVYYASHGSDEALKEKVALFDGQLKAFRAAAVYTPLHELIFDVLKTTGYGDYIKALPGGGQRAANLHMLIEKAISYEQTSYTGLFNFIRYIQKLQKYNIDFGEASVSGENENTVRITSIHKSKGLEYPIVIVAGLGKQFNQIDLKSRLVIDSAYGVASDYLDIGRRVVSPTLKKLAILKKMKEENAGEELRVLYVAMTRAQIKLILCGTVKDRETVINKKCPVDKISGKLPLHMMLFARSFFDYLLPAVQNLPESTPFHITEIQPSALVGAEIKDVSAKEERLAALSGFDPETITDELMRKTLEERFSYRYPFENRADIPVKISVSDLKHMDLEKDEAFLKYEEPDVIPLVPEFMKGEKKKTLTGADRGTAYHRFLSRLDFQNIYKKTDELSYDEDFSGDIRKTGKSAKDEGESKNSSGENENILALLRHQLTDLVKTEILSPEEGDCISLNDFVSFIKSPLAKRMAKAQERSQLHREQPFVMSVHASSVNPKWPDTESVLIQGIIDVYFEEPEGVVLLDYKTDGVKASEELITRYQIQLDTYADALERATGKKIAEKLIWSFALGETINLYV